MRLRTATHGVFCNNCKSMGSVLRTLTSRDKRLDTAAKALIEWESKLRSKGREQWIYDRVNTAHHTSLGKRWVSQNLKKIQKRVEALANVKG